MNKEQGHGDHIGAIIEPREFISNHLNDMIKTGVLLNKCKSNAVSDSVNGEMTNVITLVNDRDGIAWEFLLIEGKDHYEFASCFPLLKPVERVMARITKIEEWSNMIEATITCEIDYDDDSFEGRELSFFATDYVWNKSKYIVGEYIYIELAAIAYNAVEAMRGFSFEGQKAVDFLAKTGQKPDYDENGKVIPVQFNTENLIAFLNLNDDYPEEVQFQSPIKNIESVNTVGVDLYRCEILYKHYPDRKVALYFKSEFIPEPTDGMPLMGVLWMQGYISDNQEEFI